jgi:long-chain acyl-CoA synthetase
MLDDEIASLCVAEPAQRLVEPPHPKRAGRLGELVGGDTGMNERDAVLLRWQKTPGRSDLHCWRYAGFVVGNRDFLGAQVDLDRDRTDVIGMERLAMPQPVDRIGDQIFQHLHYHSLDSAYRETGSRGRFDNDLCLNALSCKLIVMGHDYRLTETFAIVTMVLGRDCVDHPACAGYPMPVVDVAIIAADGNEAQVGEIRVRGPGVIKAYWNDPEATRATIVDGWLRTGDLGRLDEEGFLYVVDRAKDRIIRGGENDYCVEVENALLEHLTVRDAAVIGLPHPTLGEQVTAVVEIPPNEDVSEEELKRFLATRLAAFKVPVKIELRRSPLPRNATGKLLKAQLRSELTDP